MMRKTNLRSKEMHQKYITTPKNPDFFTTAPSIEEFNHWRIINNDFPYDNVASVHHMLIPKREFRREFNFCLKFHEFLRHPIRVITGNSHMETVFEWYERTWLLLDVTSHYDAILLNFPHQQSAPQRLHFHLLIFETKNLSEVGGDHSHFNRDIPDGCCFVDEASPKMVNKEFLLDNA